MKNYDNEDNVTKLNGKPLKVTNEETFRNYYEEDLVRHNRKMKKLKNIALAVLLAGVVALNGYGLYKYFQPVEKPSSDYAYGFDIDETEWCDPEVVTRYVAPSGYALTWIDGVPYAIKETTTRIAPTKSINSEGKTVYSAPAGYTLTTIDGQMVAVKTEKTMVEPAVVQEYKAPEGYILIGTKCYKIDGPTTDYAVPEGYVRDGLKVHRDTEAEPSKGR